MSPDLNLAAAKWVKSSYSEGNGGACLEFTRDYAWVKSSHSGGDGGQCLEFTRALTTPHGLVPVRDSKNPGGPALIFPAGGWNAVVTAIKRGEFPA